MFARPFIIMRQNYYRSQLMTYFYITTSITNLFGRIPFGMLRTCNIAGSCEHSSEINDWVKPKKTQSLRLSHDYLYQ